MPIPSDIAVGYCATRGPYVDHREAKDVRRMNEAMARQSYLIAGRSHAQIGSLSRMESLVAKTESSFRLTGVCRPKLSPTEADEPRTNLGPRRPVRHFPSDSSNFLPNSTFFIEESGSDCAFPSRMPERYRWSPDDPEGASC